MTPSSQIAHYRITSKLGEGGMGAVYRATDTKLNRDVAIKVLPDSFAADPDRLARFTREAQVLASLNHPNIAAIYGVEDRALVMELVEGAEPRGPMSAAEALPLIRQLIDALEYAHDKGIVHRDLKPANLKVTPEGNLKVLDFGLAKALTNDAAGSTPDAANSPTLTMRATMAGVIMGTAGYMSPEQARGHNADRRADIWSFGVIIYELLAGKPLFDAPTVSDILAAVLRQEVDLSPVPPRFHRLLQLCLARDPRERLSHISAARLLLNEPEPALAPRAAHSKSIFAATAAIALLAGGLGVLWLAPRFQPAPPAASAVRFPLSLSMPPGRGRGESGMFELSPDGRRIAYVGQAGGVARLFVRSLDSVESQPLGGTDGARYPFWSPDGRYIAFFTDGKLKKIPAAGGPPQTICDAPEGRGGAWIPGDTIVFSPSNRSGLHRVPASGGKPVPLANFALANGDYDRYATVAGTGQLLYERFSTNPEIAGIYLGKLDGGAPVRLLPDDSQAYYVPETGSSRGWLLFAREHVLLAQPFDLRSGRLSGDPVELGGPLGDGGNTSRHAFTASASGALAMWSGGIRRRQLVWVDRTGRRLETVTEPANLSSASLSPDGKRVALRIHNKGVRGDFWIQEIGGGAPVRFTFSGVADSDAVWSPDSRFLGYAERPSAPLSKVYRRPVDGSAKEELLAQNDHQTNLHAWTPDGMGIFYTNASIENGLRILPVSAAPGQERKGTAFPTPPDTFAVTPSPDGRWVACTINAQGTFKVIVQAYAGGSPYEVPFAATAPKWSRDGRELFVERDGTVVSLPVEATATTFRTGAPNPLFAIDPTRLGYWPSPDGKRFLMAVAAEGEPVEPPVQFILNWSALVKKGEPVQ